MAISNLPSDLKIDSNTAIKDFAGEDKYYNKLIDELNLRIYELNRIVSEKEQEIANLRTSFNTALNALRSEYLTRLAELKTQIEDKQ